MAFSSVQFGDEQLPEEHFVSLYEIVHVPLYTVIIACLGIKYWYFYSDKHIWTIIS